MYAVWRKGPIDKGPYFIHSCAPDDEPFIYLKRIMEPQQIIGKRVVDGHH